MRKNPPSPLHRGKRKSGPPTDKHSKWIAMNLSTIALIVTMCFISGALNMTYSISPSSTTASFGSGTVCRICWLISIEVCRIYAGL